MDKLQKEVILNLLSCLRQDFEMLDSGEWVPDQDSTNASIEAIDRIISIIKKER